MAFNAIFRKPKNELEKGGRPPSKRVESDIEMAQTCPNCGTANPISELWETLYVCKCGHCFRLTARQRISYLTDERSFNELYADIESKNPISFPGYPEKLEQMRKTARESEAVICGTASIANEKCALFVMEPYFMMGSMGAAVGEKITLLFEYATENAMPLIGCTVSGGARMQEGIISLMQMAKTSGAAKRHSDAGNLYITLLTDPTTGGVTASFAMQGDILIAEPGAIIGFAGARVVEQTVRKKLPAGFQKAEVMLEHGFLDMIVERKDQRQIISQLLKMHSPPKNTTLPSPSQS
ncbi:MAG: acetyl-CoA carboxylase carboxyl transferase subunit beta [Oscillospiraceae bacterium]|nr:acetyl-CoA carboxylase carboxyl transferase subunit beta [Oscillospiraceae bacterium]